MQHPGIAYEINKLHLAELRRIAEENRIVVAGNNQPRVSLLTRLAIPFRRSAPEAAPTKVLTTQELRAINVIR